MAAHSADAPACFESILAQETRNRKPVCTAEPGILAGFPCLRSPPGTYGPVRLIGKRPAEFRRLRLSSVLARRAAIVRARTSARCGPPTRPPAELGRLCCGAPNGRARAGEWGRPRGLAQRLGRALLGCRHRSRATALRSGDPWVGLQARCFYRQLAPPPPIDRSRGLCYGLFVPTMIAFTRDAGPAHPRLPRRAHGCCRHQATAHDRVEQGQGLV